MSSSTQLLLCRRVARGSFLSALSIFFSLSSVLAPGAAEKEAKGINRRVEQGDKVPHNFQQAHFEVTNARRLSPQCPRQDLPLRRTALTVWPMCSCFQDYQGSRHRHQEPELQISPHSDQHDRGSLRELHVRGLQQARHDQRHRVPHS